MNAAVEGCTVSDGLELVKELLAADAVDALFSVRDGKIARTEMWPAAASRSRS